MSPLLSSFLLVRSSCRSLSTSRAPRIPSSRFSRSSVRMRISSARLRSSFSICSCSICLARSSFSCPLRLKMRTSTIVPSMPGGQVSDASRTSPAFSPKMARSSFSSGVNWVSPLGVTLPTRMSLCPTLAPMRMIPESSRSRSACSLTLGMSRVISSGPSLVSRASISNSSMWMEV